MRYDLIIIGADEAGIEAAIVADEMLLRVAIVEPEATTELQAALAFSCVDRFYGDARFLDSQEIAVQADQKSIRLQADAFIIATGSRSARPAHIPFDGATILDADEMRRLNPQALSLTVIGGDPDGIELAIHAARRGAKVTIVDGREQVGEARSTMSRDEVMTEANRLGIDFRLNEQVIAIEKTSPTQSTVQLAGGQQITSEYILFSDGRVGNTEGLNLDGIGVETDEWGQLWCNDDQQTWVENVYGVGDVVGFPLPPQLPKQQSRQAIMHAFGQSVVGRPSSVNHIPNMLTRYESHQATAL